MEPRRTRRRAPPNSVSTEDRPLIEAARQARRRAYAPYSRFRVGAAVMANGRVFSGCNVENASYGLTLCAERVAVATAVAAGEYRIQAVAVASATVPPTPPCGMCLQTLVEFGGAKLKVILVGPRGAPIVTSLSEFLPRAFSRKFL